MQSGGGVMHARELFPGLLGPVDGTHVRVSDSFLEKYSGLSKLGPAELAEIWQHYDRDNSGYIEVGPELESLLSDVLRASGEEVTELKLRDFIDGVLELFDVNADGKLERSELEQLLTSE